MEKAKNSEGYNARLYTGKAYEKAQKGILRTVRSMAAGGIKRETVGLDRRSLFEGTGDFQSEGNSKIHFGLFEYG